MTLTTPFIPNRFMASVEDPTHLQQNDWVLVGLPYDGTTSFRPGTRFGPQAIRQVSNGIETYSPVLDKDLEDILFWDAGDLDLPIGNREACLAMIKQTAQDVIASGKRWMGLGGEHLATLPAFAAHIEKYPDIVIVHFDAHADLRDNYLGEPLSHACVIRRCMDLMKNPKRLMQIGIRSGPREEFQWMREHQTLMPNPEKLASQLKDLGNPPIYLTIDLDFFDPALFPGTGTPEPGGLFFPEFYQWLNVIAQHNIVGADIMELSPQYDTSGVSSIVAAKTLRECLLAL